AIGDAGAIALARSTCLESLEELHLFDNAIGERGRSILRETPILRATLLGLNRQRRPSLLDVLREQIGLLRG
ncbi:MAG: hypothetical protein AAFS10_16110, partial [Myxococcota bacterium]